jgi:hypothetical protein
MPLSATTLPGRTDEHRRGIEFWMTDAEGRRVRVIASYVALHELGLLSKPRTAHEAFSVFNAHRRAIEAAASRLFDANRMTVDMYGGEAFVIVRSMDLDLGG